MLNCRCFAFLIQFFIIFAYTSNKTAKQFIFIFHYWSFLRLEINSIKKSQIDSTPTHSSIIITWPILTGLWLALDKNSQLYTYTRNENVAIFYFCSVVWWLLACMRIHIYSHHVICKIIYNTHRPRVFGVWIVFFFI